MRCRGEQELGKEGEAGKGAREWNTEEGMRGNIYPLSTDMHPAILNPGCRWKIAILLDEENQDPAESPATTRPLCMQEVSFRRASDILSR